MEASRPIRAGQSARIYCLGVGVGVMIGTSPSAGLHCIAWTGAGVGVNVDCAPLDEQPAGISNGSSHWVTI